MHGLSLLIGYGRISLDSLIDLTITEVPDITSTEPNDDKIVTSQKGYSYRVIDLDSPSIEVNSDSLTTRRSDESSKRAHSYSRHIHVEPIW